MGAHNSGYCKNYYTLFVATQHVSLDAGGTILYPTTHILRDITFKGNEVQAVLNPGDAFLYNWRLKHRAGENLLYNARILLALTFETEGKGMFYDARMLSMCKGICSFCDSTLKVR